MKFLVPILQQWFLCPLFALVYKKWLWNEFYGTYDKVLHVKGWRSARVQSVSKSGVGVNVKYMQPCFLWFR